MAEFDFSKSELVKRAIGILGAGNLHCIHSPIGIIIMYTLHCTYYSLYYLCTPYVAYTLLIVYALHCYTLMPYILLYTLSYSL